MGLPFSPEQFFDLFARYNRSFIVPVAALWLVVGVVLVRAWRSPGRSSRAVSGVLAGLWLWSAVVYHAFLFSRINPAAWLFAAAFLLQAALLASIGRRQKIEYFSAKGLRGITGVLLVIYALVYPFLSAGVGEGYPATPTFGVPCPTAILTIGLLLTVRGAVPPALAIVPAFWAFVGGAAAVLLQVPTDYVLLGGGVVLIGVLTSQLPQRRGVGAAGAPLG